MTPATIKQPNAQFRRTLHRLMHGNLNFGIILAVTISSANPALADPPDLAPARAAVVRAAVQKITPAIVTIETIGGAQPIQSFGSRGMMEERFKLAEGPTTGLIHSADGLIVTSSFNFAREPSVITVTLADGRRFVGKLLGRDLIRRIALLKIEAQDLPSPRWLTRDEITIGQYAIACGRALGGTTPHISLGIISAQARRSGSAVQTDAKLSPVNYGGPLIDLEGRVIGLIVPMTGAGGSLAGAEWYDSGIGFAVYRHRVDQVFDRLQSGETIEPGKIGVVLTPNETQELEFLEKILPSSGVKIAQVATQSPAARADLKVDDLITGLDGQSIGDIMDLQRRLSDHAAGDQVTLTLRRRWRTFEVKIRLAREADIKGLEPKQPPPDKKPPESPDKETPPPTSEPSPD